VRTILAGLCILAVARPADALLVTASLIGFGIILSHLAGIPLLRVTDALVAVSLLGCSVRALQRGTPFRLALAERISVPIVLFGLAAVASTLVWLRVYQVQWGSASAYLQAFVQFVSRDYFVRPGEFWLIVSTVAILQGLALYVVVAAWCQADTTFFARGLRMLTIGGAALAAMSIVRLWEILLRNPYALEQLRKTYDGVRISPQIPDYIAAGSYFSLCWMAALGLLIASARYGQRLMWVVASALLIAGLYLTGSRSVIAAAVGGVVVLVFATFVRKRAAAFRGVIAAALVAVVVMIASFRWMIGHDVAGETARASLSVRGELLRVGLHVIQTRPLFGVGIDRFYLVAGTVKSTLLDALWASRRNPHNDFLRFAGELGLVGLGLFVWILASAGARIWATLRRQADPRLAALAGGLVAFLITSMVSNPLMLREVSYVFWIALGLAVGRSATLSPPHDATPVTVPPTSSMKASTLRTSAAWLLGGLLLVSIPFRAKQELTTIDPTRVSFGLSDWDRDRDGRRFRWSGPHATVYVSGRARRVEIPLSGTLPSGAAQHVQVHLDGRLVNDIAIGSDWQQPGVVLPATNPTKPRRIDLIVSPTWVRGDAISGSEDRTVVGVKVGELNVIF
jgi:O-Antigen ligase